MFWVFLPVLSVLGVSVVEYDEEIAHHGATEDTESGTPAQFVVSTVGWFLLSTPLALKIFASWCIISDFARATPMSTQTILPRT
jgi:hypothetical protein